MLDLDLGDDACRRVRQTLRRRHETRDIPVLVVAGHDQRLHAEKLLADLQIAHVSKPIETGRFSRTVAGEIRRRTTKARDVLEATA